MIDRLGKQLMTIEEANRLSYGDSSRDSRAERQSIWAWQTVEGVLSGEINDEAISRMMARSSRKR